MLRERTLLSSVLAVCLVSTAALVAAASDTAVRPDDPAPAVEAPAVAPLAEAPTTEAPEGADGQDVTALPDLDTPEPVYLCKAGMCSNDEQCRIWTGDPSAECSIPPGGTCGWCLL